MSFRFVLHFDEAGMREKSPVSREEGEGYITFICQQYELHAGCFANDYTEFRLEIAGKSQKSSNGG